MSSSRPRARVLAPIAVLLLSGTAHAQTPGGAGAVAGAPAAESEKKAALPAEHVPKISVTYEPDKQVMTGDLIHLHLRADAPEGDDVTVPEQSFAPFEVTAKRVHTEPEHDGRRAFVFDVDLLALEPGKHELSSIVLRVVTKDGVVGEAPVSTLTLEVKSLLGNEPNAAPKAETTPVVVMEDDFTLLYVGAGVLGAGLIALLTWLVMRYLARRPKPVTPPPPPRPPWEIAVTRLAELRRRKQQMLRDGLAAQFVDEVSDVVRQYLGALFGFDGLETTTDEMLELLRARNAKLGLWQEVAAYLRRCDLVKFAKVEPDEDEIDLVFAKAQDIVQFSMPVELHDGAARGGATEIGTQAETEPKPEPGAPPPENRGPA